MPCVPRELVYTNRCNHFPLRGRKIDAVFCGLSVQPSGNPLSSCFGYRMNCLRSNSESSFRRAPVWTLLLGIVLLLAVLHLWPAGVRAQAVIPGSPQYHIEAARWQEAEKIFRSDPRWLGGDGAASVDLGHGRVLWLFGDSFIDPSGSGSRRTSDLVRNSIAVQTGYDPTSASMEFAWKIKNGKPEAFFARQGENWYWPASGVMVGKRLLVFLMEIGTAKNELGFEARGWKAVLITNPQEEPGRWRLTYLKSPQRQGLIVGAGNALLENGFLKAFAADGKDRGVYLVRWPERSAHAGTLTSPQWWAGDKEGWVGSPTDRKKPQRIIAEGQTEFTVEYRPQLQRYLQIQTLSLINPCVAISAAAAATGPWSGQTCFFSPPEQGMPDLLIYAGKSHPVLRGADMTFSYCVNTTKEDRLLTDMTIYFPIMLKGWITTDGTAP